MNPNSIVAWSITVLITIALILYFKMKNRKKEKMTFLPLQNFANENNCVISSYDHWDSCLIGLSQNGISKLFFIRKINNVESRVLINLSEVKSVRMTKNAKSIKVKGENHSITEKIMMVFSFNNTQKHDVVLDIYNFDYDPLTIWRELEIAQKWTELVKSIISKNAILKHEYQSTLVNASNKLNVAKTKPIVSSNSNRRKKRFATEVI